MNLLDLPHSKFCKLLLRTLSAVLGSSTVIVGVLRLVEPWPSPPQSLLFGGLAAVLYVYWGRVDMSWLDWPTEPAEESAPTEPAEESDLSGIDAFLSKWEEERTAPSDSVVTHKIMVTHKIFVSPGEDAFAAVDDYATSRGLYVVEQDDKLFLTDGSPDKLEPVETVETVETVEPDDLDPPDEEIWTF